MPFYVEKGDRAMTEEIGTERQAGEPFFTTADWDAEQHPSLWSVSSGMMGLRVVPVLKTTLPVESVKIPVAGSMIDDKVSIAAQAFNSTWQSGAAWGNWRGGFFGYDELEDWPEPIRNVLERCEDNTAIRFVPTGNRPSLAIAQHAPLYQLLPLKSLQRHRLPVLGRRPWPTPFFGDHDLDLVENACALRSRIERAFAAHIWPLLVPQSGLIAFSKDDPIRLLAFNLDFWMPYLDRIVEERLRSSGKAKFRDIADRRVAVLVRRELGEGYAVEAPLYHAEAWRGEVEAWEVTRELVENADNNGNLRGIIDAVRSHRIQDDFSDKWSWAKEDFERKLYRKRLKSRVTFVELHETLPVHGPDKECDIATSLLWDDLLALVDQKDRHVVVLLRNGVTRVSEIAEVLGYANHSAVSKKLARIRVHARRFLA
jgi:hypothetical protein